MERKEPIVEKPKPITSPSLNEQLYYSVAWLQTFLLGKNMVEKEKLFYFSLASFGLLAISFFAFPLEIKKQVRKEQRNICAMCGRKVKKLQIHHRIPQSLGGSDTRENAIGLCSDCHKIADELALRLGKFP